MSLIISCDSKIESEIKEEVFNDLKIEVIDVGFINSDTTNITKTEEVGYKTNFTQGDKIGVFVVENNEILYSNELVVYDGINWEGDIRVKSQNTMLFAYYPYDENIEIGQLTISSGLSAEAFFSNYINSKITVKDQGKYDSYTHADLMVSKGTFMSNKVTFNMEHQMSLLVINLPKEMKYITEYYLKSDNDYKWQRYKIKPITNITNIGFYGFTPYCCDDISYRYIVPPNVNKELSGIFTANDEDKIYKINTSNLSKGVYKEYNITAISEIIPKIEHKLTIGDIFLDDGGLISQDPLDQIENHEQGKCVGIVFQTDITRIGYREKSVLSNLGVKSPHGLVMALKMASVHIAWSTSLSDENLLFDKISLSDCIFDINGYNNTYSIIDKLGSSSLLYPAFYTAISYQPISNNKRTTGWFFPSIGQWIDILKNLGNADFTNSNNVSNNNNSFYISGVSNSVPQTINNYFSKINSSYNLFSVGNVYWSSSEYDAQYPRHVSFDRTSGNLLINKNLSKNTNCSVRCVLAF